MNRNRPYTERELWQRMTPTERVCYTLSHAIPALFFLGTILYVAARVLHIRWG